MNKILLTVFVSIMVILVIYVAFNGLESSLGEVLLQFQANPSLYTAYSILILSSDIFLPVPSSIIMYLNGSVLGVFWGFITSLIAVIISSIAGYFMGVAVSKSMLSTENVEANKLISRIGFFAIIISRGVPVLSESICIVCGYHKFDFRRYLIFNLLGYVPVCFIYAYFGSLGATDGKFLLSFLSALLISLILWLTGKKLLD